MGKVGIYGRRRHEFSQSHYVRQRGITWFYRVLAGINVDPSVFGFRRIMIKPYIPGDLSYVSENQLHYPGFSFFKLAERNERAGTRCHFAG